MEHWNALIAHLHNNYEIADAEDKSVTLVFEYPDGRRRAVVVSQHDAMGQAWCDISSALCRLEQMDPADAARRNFSLAAGSIALDGEVYVVRYAVPVSSLDPDHLVYALQIVTATANRIENELEPPERARALG